jgi:Transposase DDE domain
MKMADRGRLRKVHRRDWPGFLNRMIPAAAWQAFLGRLSASKDPRIHWIVKYVLLCWVAIGWSVQISLGERFREGRELLVGLYPRRRRPGISYQGLVKATGRLGTGIFRALWEVLRGEFAWQLGQAWTWHGWVVMSADGSRIDAPRTRSNERGRGGPGIAGRGKTHPQWWVTWVVHLPTLLIWDWRQGPGCSSERSHVQEMAKSLPARTLLVADVGFGGFDFLRSLGSAGVHFLVRCASNTTLLAQESRCRIERRGEHGLVYLWPTHRRGQAPLCLRLIVLKHRGQRVYLLTSVLDPGHLPRRVASDFYRARWGIEVEYRSLKQTLGRRKVLAKTPKAGTMELAGNILGLALLLLQGALACAKRLSVAQALRVIHAAIEAVRCCLSTAWFIARLRQAERDSYQRHSSKRARDWPHKKKDPVPRPPKLRRPTPHEKHRIMALCGGICA